MVPGPMGAGGAPPSKRASIHCLSTLRALYSFIRGWVLYSFTHAALHADSMHGNTAYAWFVKSRPSAAGNLTTQARLAAPRRGLDRNQVCVRQESAFLDVQEERRRDPKRRSPGAYPFDDAGDVRRVP